MAGKRSTRKLRSIRRRRRNRDLLTLPAELVDEILIRLPVKSIIRCQLVSKEWQFKLHSTSFKEFYQQSNNNNVSESKTMKLEDLYRMAPELQQKPGNKVRISTMGPLSNGIYCFTSIPMDEYAWRLVKIWRCRIGLCNPAIRHFKLLPRFPRRFRPELTRASSGFFHVVFGFDRLPYCSDYRVVVVINYGRLFSECFLVFVCSTNSGEWEKLVDYIPGENAVGPPSATQAFTQGRGTTSVVAPNDVCPRTLLNGCWHWVVLQDEDYAILSFNFALQSFKLIPELPVRMEDNRMIDVVVLHDRLALLNLSSNYLNKNLEYIVWMMMDHGIEKSWTKIFTITCDGARWYSLLYKIDYHVVKVDAGKKSERDEVVVERLFVVDGPSREVISFDHYDGEQKSCLRHDSKENISMSMYSETLERLY